MSNNIMKTFRVSEEIESALAKYCSENYRNQADVIRQSLFALLKEEKYIGGKEDEKKVC